MPSKLDGKITARSFGNMSEKNASVPTRQQKGVTSDDKVFDLIPIDLIVTDKNVRENYNEQSINELAESIGQYGLLQPIRVYERDSEYFVIFGHRRLLACKKAGKKFVECIVSTKLDTLDTVYVQIIENEQKENLSSADLHKYINLLKTKYRQSVDSISQKTGKSKDWVYDVLNAVAVREKHEDKFNKAGLTLTVSDAKKIKNASEEQVIKAVELVTENPGSKKAVLNALSDKNSKRKAPKKEKKKFFEEDSDDKNNGSSELHENSGPVIDSADSENKEPVNETSNIKTMDFHCKITIDEDNMKVKFNPSILGSTYKEGLIPACIEKWSLIFSQEGYTIEK